MRHMIVIVLLALFAVTGFTQTVAPQNTIVTYPSGLTAGRAGTIYFQERSATNETILLNTCSGVTSPFTVKVSLAPQNAKPVTFTNAACAPNKANSFSISINTQTAGTYVLESFYKGTLIQSSIQSIVTSPSVISPQFSYMSGLGLSYALVGENTTFGIQAVDQYENVITNCSTAIINPSQFSITLYQPTVFEEVQGVLGPCNKGHFNPTYVVNVTGNWLLVVKYAGYNLNNSQPNVLAEPGPPVAAYCVLTGPGLLGAQAGEETWFSFSCIDGYGNQITYCSPNYTNLWTPEFISSSNTFYATLNSCNNVTGVLNYTYTETQAANYTSNVYFNGNTTNQLPSFYPVISPGPPDPGMTIATGNGVSNTPLNVAGQVTSFYIDESDEYQNPIPGCIVAIWDIDVTPVPGIQDAGTPYCAGTHLSSNYTANVTGTYTIDIKLNGTTINNGVLYQSVVYSNILVPNQATATYSSSIVAGGTGTFSVSGFDVYGNAFDNCGLYNNVFTGWTVTLVNSVNTEIVGTGSITGCAYQGEIGYLNGVYTATATGTYNLTISYNNISIRSPAPGIVTVTPAVLSPSASLAIGQGFGDDYNVTLNAGTAGSFQIIQYDQFGNLITDCQPLGFAWIANFTNSDGTLAQTDVSTFFDCTSTGSYPIEFNLKQVGSYFIKVTPLGSSTQINNTNGLVNIIPAAFDAANSENITVSTNMSVGQSFIVSTYAYDAYGNPINENRNLALTFTAVSPNASLSGSLSYVSGNIYQGSFIPQYAGTYLVTVFYNNLTIVGTAPAVAFYGQFSTNGSYANGTAFYQNVVAGTWGYFVVYTFNDYGFPIPASIIDPGYFTVDFINGGNNYSTIPVIANNQEYLNAVAFTFNATIALNYDVYIYFNSVLISGDYSTNVIAAALDPNTLRVTGLNSSATSNGTGEFSITGTDAFMNPVDVGNDVQVYFDPVCANTQINCTNADGNELSCTYQAFFAGTYCVEIFYAPDQTYYSTTASTVVVGGTGCENLCSNQGYCFPQGPADSLYNQTDGDCYCFQGYTGDDCSVKISKHYWNLWLGVGLIVGIPIILAIIGFVVGCLIGRR